jgi:hypothetical protein
MKTHNVNFRVVLNASVTVEARNEESADIKASLFLQSALLACPKARPNKTTLITNLIVPELETTDVYEIETKKGKKKK